MSWSSFHDFDSDIKVTARSKGRCNLTLFRISLTGYFWHKNSYVYTYYKGGCQDPGVDLDLKVTVTLQGKVKAPLSG